MKTNPLICTKKSWGVHLRKVFFACFSLFIFSVSGALAADAYVCDKIYYNCKSGYYLSNCDGTTKTAIDSADLTSANSCKACSNFGDNYDCTGGAFCPTLKGVKITYNLNSGTNNSFTTTHTCIIGQECDLDKGDHTNFIRTGHVFVGWGLSTSTAAASAFTKYTFSEATTVYAIWTACSAGTSKNANLNANQSCTDCNAGFYQNNTGKSSCNACPMGTYSDEKKQTKCKLCDNGKTTEKEASSSKSYCKACSNSNDYVNWAAMSWNNGTVKNLCTVTSCKKGSAYSTNKCTACANGTYMESDNHTNAACSKCSDLTAVSVAGGAYSTDPQSGATANTACQYKGPTTKTFDGCSGYATPNTVTYTGSAWPKTTFTVSASAGHIISGSGTENPSCSKCTGATFSAGGSATSCTNCPAATDGWTRRTGDGWSKVTDCYQTKTGAAISSYCSAGELKQTATDGSTWGTASITTPLQAVAGAYVSGQTCKMCAGGNYSAGGTATSCTQITGGYFSSGGATKAEPSSTDCISGQTCGKCSAGYKCPAGASSQTACGTGTYQDYAGQTDCKSCTLSNNTGFTAWVTSSALTTNSCKFTCEANKYVVDLQNRKCLDCSPQASCSTVHSSYSGTYNTCLDTPEKPEDHCTIKCSAGKYVKEAGQGCVPVDVSGKYAEEHTVKYGQKSELSGCPSSDNTVGSNNGAKAATECYTACPATKSISNGTATRSLNSGNAYYDSNAKTYTNYAACKYDVNCEARYGSQASGSNATTHGTNNPTCTQCGIGYYSAGGSAICQPCAGIPASPIAVFTSNGTTANNCRWQCAAGRYKSGQECPACPTSGVADIPTTSSNEDNGSGGYLNDSIGGCYIAPYTANNNFTYITDETGVFRYKALNDGGFKPCYHKVE